MGLKQGLNAIKNDETSNKKNLLKPYSSRIKSRDEIIVGGEDNNEDDYLNKQINIGLDDSSLMRASFAAGCEMWPSDDDFVFLFSARYNSEAFAKSYLQSEYREKIHSVFTGLVEKVIEQKLKYYENNILRKSGKNSLAYHAFQRKFGYTQQQFLTVKQKADALGIDMTLIDVGALIYDVEISLQKMAVNLISSHPELSKNESTWVINFMLKQMWSEKDQLLWRYVTASTLAEFYKYDNIHDSIVILQNLDKMIRDAFSFGELRGRNPVNAYFGHLLSDDIILDIKNLLNSDDYKNTSISFIIDDVISQAQYPDSW